MSFSENSNICVSSGSIQLIILIIYCVFLPLCTPGNFWQDARYCEFYFVGCWVFLHSIKSWALFRDTVKLLGNRLILSDCFYDLLGGSGTVLSQGLIIVHYEGKIFWKTLPNVTYVSLYSMWLGEQSPSPALGSNRCCPCEILVDGSDGSFLTCSTDLPSAEYSQNPSGDLLSLLSVQHAPPRYAAPWNSRRLGLQTLFAWPVQLIHSTGLCLHLPSQCHGLETFSRQSAEVNAGLSFFVFHLSRVTVFQCLIYRALNLLFPYFIWTWGLLQVGTWFPIRTLPGPEAQVQFSYFFLPAMNFNFSNDGSMISCYFFLLANGEPGSTFLHATWTKSSKSLATIQKHWWDKHRWQQLFS